MSARPVEIRIDCDARDMDGDGTSHFYEMIVDVDGYAQHVGALQFQHGARFEAGSIDGVTDNAVLGILIDRFECKNSQEPGHQGVAYVLSDLMAARAEMLRLEREPIPRKA